MKKILTVSLALCLLFALVASFAVSTAAEELDISVGFKSEWNDQTEADVNVWRTGKGVSPDGLWKYQYYPIKLGKYMDLKVFTTKNFYSWTESPGDTGIGWARVYENGAKFHPAELADVVKTFTCPSGGTVQIDFTIRRQYDWVAESGTPSSFAIYVEDQLVYPTDGSEYLTLSSATDQSESFEVEVKKNEHIYFRVGAMDDQGGDGVYMSNSVTYKSVTNEEAEIPEEPVSTSTATISDNLGLTVSDIVIDQEVVDKVQSEKEEDAKTSSKKDTAKDEEGSSIGLIIGIVAAVVVVAGVAAAVIIVKKKK